MSGTVSKFNTYTFFKLPSAWWCGVRLKALNNKSCVTSVKLGWRNQNPFKSMFWAVQGMAAELSTGAIVIAAIKKSNKKISMLVLNNSANFSKKAVGRITFICEDGDKLLATIEKTVTSGEGETVWMKTIGTDEQGDVVSTFNFEWTLKVKSE